MQLKVILIKLRQPLPHSCVHHRAFHSLLYVPSLNSWNFMANDFCSFLHHHVIYSVSLNSFIPLSMCHFFLATPSRSYYLRALHSALFFSWCTKIISWFETSLGAHLVSSRLFCSTTLLATSSTVWLSQPLFKQNIAKRASINSLSPSAWQRLSCQTMKLKGLAMITLPYTPA